MHLRPIEFIESIIKSEMLSVTFPFTGNFNISSCPDSDGRVLLLALNVDSSCYS